MSARRLRFCCREHGRSLKSASERLSGLADPCKLVIWQSSLWLRLPPDLHGSKPAAGQPAWLIAVLKLPCAVRLCHPDGGSRLVSSSRRLPAQVSWYLRSNFALGAPGPELLGLPLTVLCRAWPLCIFCR